MFDERSPDLSLYPTYLSIGSNLGDRERAVLGLARCLETQRIATRIRVSALYETEPVACQSGGDFVNAVVELQPLLSPGDLLIGLKALEKMMGRAGGHNEPRELDIDIVAMGETTMQTGELTIPHPRYAERAFVLVPLQELAPAFRCPTTGQSVAQLLDTLSDRHRVEMISARRIVFA